MSDPAVMLPACIIASAMKCLTCPATVRDSRSGGMLQKAKRHRVKRNRHLGGHEKHLEFRRARRTQDDFRANAR